MKVVNLSGRPFVNRRPLVRLGVALWVLGGLLVLVNLALFQSYWSDSRDVRGELAEAEGQVATELQELEALDRQIERVNLAQQNSQAAYLNSLISYRTFPWSALFDDLERVMPLDVRVQTVTPAVKLAAEEALERTEREARRRQVEQRRNRRNRRSSSGQDTGQAAAEGPQLAQDEVQLRIQGLAKNEDALIEFLDTLYRDASFRLPVLSGERFENAGGQLNSSFEISVIYLTRARLGEDAAPEDESVGAELDSADGTEGGDDEAPGDEGSDGNEGGEGQSVTASGDVAAPEAPTSQPPTQQASSEPSAVAPVAPPPPRNTEPQRSEPTPETRRPSSRTDRAGDTASSAPSASESAADARRRRIEELRQRRREAIRRSRSSSGSVSPQHPFHRSQHPARRRRLGQRVVPCATLESSRDVPGIAVARIPRPPPARRAFEAR